MSERDLERATAGAPGRETLAGGGRLGWTGVPGIDDLLPGGLPYDSQLMVLGDTGVGKSVLAAQFVYEGLVVGDTCVYVACDEPPDAMRQSMAALRLGTVAWERAGRLVFLDAYGRERSPERRRVPDPTNLDEYFAHEREAIDGLGGRPVRLAVDSISTLFGTLDPSAVLEFNRSRLRWLRSRRVLTLDSYVTGLLTERTEAGLSHAYPLILRLGFQAADGEMLRWLQLGKVRSGMFSGQRRQFRIDARAGLVVQR